MHRDGITSVILSLEEMFKDKKSFIYVNAIPEYESLSEEELSFIETNKNVFFLASRSRIILVHWICECMRKIFEKYDYSDLDLYNETYEQLRNSFKTKAFNRADLLKLFNCNKNSILSYDDFMKFESQYIDEYNKLVDEDNQLSHITHIYVVKKESEINLKQELENIMKNKKQKEVLVYRSEFKTLDQIGEILQVTRERARQIEIKPKSFIERWLENRGDMIFKQFSKNGLVPSKNMIKYFGEENWKIIRYVLISNDKTNKNPRIKLHYIEAIDSIIHDPKNQFNELILEFVQQDINNIDEISKKMIEKSYEFATTEVVEKCALQLGMNVYNNNVHSNKLSIGKSILDAANTKYKDGVNISNKKELEQFAQYLNKHYTLDVKIGRALTTRIQDILIMADKTTYISPDRLVIDEKLDKIIVDFINNMSEDRITYQTLFDKLINEIQKYSNIDNYHFLHGYIKKNEERLNVVALRYYVCKNEVENITSSEYFVRLKNLLVSEKQDLSDEYILEKLEGWQPTYLRYAMIYYPEIVQWTKNTYLDLTIINADKYKKQLEELIKKLTNNKLKYTNEYLLYDEVCKEMPEFIKDNRITESGQIFHILQYYIPDGYHYSRPHIVAGMSGNNSFTTNTLINKIIKNSKVIYKNDLIRELKQYYGSKNSSLSLAIQETLNSFIRIDSNKYYKKSKFELTKEDITLINSYIKKHIEENGMILPNTMDYSNFPELPFKWNDWVLSEIINIYKLNYTLLTKRNNPAVFTAIIVEKDSSFKDKEEAVKYLIDNKFGEKFDKEEVCKYLKTLGIYPSITICSKIVDTLYT